MCVDELIIVPTLIFAILYDKVKSYTCLYTFRGQFKIASYLCKGFLHTFSTYPHCLFKSVDL